MSTFRIEIPEPCHENWATMSVEERGRHCAVCNKTVVDFTKDSPQQFNSKLKEFHSARADVCGRFTGEQVYGPPKEKYHIIQFAGLNLNPFQQFLFAFAFAFFLGGFSYCKVDTIMGSVVVEPGYGPGVSEHLKNFEDECGEGNGIVTMGTITVKPDTSTRITVAPMHVVQFQKDSVSLSKETMLLLDLLTDSLQNSRNYSVEVIGHSDNRGGEQLNKELSLQRATGVKIYLEEKGITVDTCRGVGYQYPVANNETEEGRAKNRRVEILVTKKKR